MKANYCKKGDLDTVQGLSWRYNDDVWFYHDANVGWFNLVGKKMRYDESWMMSHKGKIIGDQDEASHS